MRVPALSDRRTLKLQKSPARWPLAKTDVPLVALLQRLNRSGPRADKRDHPGRRSVYRAVRETIMFIYRSEVSGSDLSIGVCIGKQRVTRPNRVVCAQLTVNSALKQLYAGPQYDVILRTAKRGKIIYQTSAHFYAAPRLRVFVFIDIVDLPAIISGCAIEALITRVLFISAK